MLIQMTIAELAAHVGGFSPEGCIGFFSAMTFVAAGVLILGTLGTGGVIGWALAYGLSPVVAAACAAAL